MKTTLTLLAAVCAAAVVLAGQAGDGKASCQTIPARLEWTVTTNWSAGGEMTTLLYWTGDKNPNVTTYYERGTIQSNLVAHIEWKGRVSSVVIETIYIGTTNRSYTISEPTRIYR